MHYDLLLPIAEAQLNFGDLHAVGWGALVTPVKSIRAGRGFIQQNGTKWHFFLWYGTHLCVVAVELELIASSCIHKCLLS